MALRILIELWIGELHAPRHTLCAQDHRMEFAVEFGVKKVVCLELDDGFDRFDEVFICAHSNSIHDISGTSHSGREKLPKHRLICEAALFQSLYVAFIVI